jgi:ABC-type spermidine/putrescine transport system permease subunit I
LLEAAADLGCEPWEAFLRVTLPLSIPGVVAGFFFAFIPTLGEYVTPMLVGGRSLMYGNMIRDQFAEALNWPMGSVMSLAMLAAVLALLFLFTRVVSLSDLLEL